MAAEPRADGELGPRTKAFIARVQSSRVPACGSIELTHRCNLACTHCYVNLPAADRGAQVREMTTAQVCKLIDELADLGTLSLTLTGGEPLLRPDFPEIYRHAHQKGIMVVVYSNKEKSHKLTDIGLAVMRPTQSTRTRWENVG